MLDTVKGRVPITEKINKTEVFFGRFPGSGQSGPHGSLLISGYVRFYAEGILYFKEFKSLSSPFMAPMVLDKSTAARVNVGIGKSRWERITPPRDCVSGSYGHSTTS